MKTGSHCLSVAGLNGLELFSTSSTSPVASSHRGIPSACSDSSGFLFLLHLLLGWIFSLWFSFFFEIMKFHCSLLLLPCSFGSFFICVGMRVSRCIWRWKDSFLELTFSCCLVGSRGWALSSGLPARPLPAEPSEDPPFSLSFGGSFYLSSSTCFRRLGLALSERHNMDSSSVWASDHFPIRVHIQGSRLGTIGQSGLAARSLLAWEPSLAMQISPPPLFLVLIGMLYSKSNSHP